MPLFKHRYFRRIVSVLMLYSLMYGGLYANLPRSIAQQSGTDSTLTPTLLPTQAVHFVGYGETLLSIARTYRVSVIAIAQANNINDPNTIYVGQRLFVPLAPPPISTQSPADVLNEAAQNASITALSELSTIAPTPSPITPTVDTPTITATLTFFGSESSTYPTIDPSVSGIQPMPTALTLNLPTPTQQPFTNLPVQPETTDQVAASTQIVSVATAQSTPPTGVNGIAFDQFIIMDERVRQNTRAIYNIGQILGRNPHAFSKVGDSTIENPFFMDRFDRGDYNLGDYGYLQPVIDHYRGSFERDSIAVRVGLHSWSVLDPMWADPYQCRGGESMLACEIRVHNPSVLIIRLGSNDAGVPRSVDRSLRSIIDFCIMNGIIPILGTKADRFDGSNSPNNQIIRQIAVDYGLLLWDYDLVAATLPNRGLVSDGVHLTFTAHDYTRPAAFQYGHSVHSLTGLMALEAVMNVIQDSE